MIKIQLLLLSVALRHRRLSLEKFQGQQLPLSCVKGFQQKIRDKVIKEHQYYSTEICPTD